MSLRRLDPRIHDRNGQTIFPQFEASGHLSTTALIYVEVVVDGAKLCKAVELPMDGKLADYLKAGWVFGRTVP